MQLKKEITKTYDNIARDYDREFCKTIYFSEELDFFLSGLPRNAKLLDAGCGTGHIAEYCENKGFDVLGIDLSEGMLEIAKARCKAARFEKKDVENYSYGKGKFDGIIALFILIHLKSFEKTLKKFHSALRQGGFLFLGMAKGKGEFFGKEPLNPEMKMFFKYTTRKEISQLLEKSGFTITKFTEKKLETEHEKQTEFFIVAQKN